ncbi:protein kinase [Myxococcaceae bacterium GXIMD 01537]
MQEWTVVRLLGVGGFGFVYEVERDGRRFALKMASQTPGPSDAEHLDARARNEVACLRMLTHPNVVRVHAQGRWPRENAGRHYFVMDLVEGERLSDWCLRARPTLDAVVEVGQKLALALAALHDAGILHRDLKQDNVLVRTDGEPVLIDFGIATHAGASPLTTHILPPGTTHYRSPESITFFRRRHFEPGGSYTFRPTDDLYALGVLLYETLTGRPPFPPHLPEPQLLGAIEFLTPPAPNALNPQVPGALGAVVMRLLAKKPEERYAGGRELHAALASARGSLGEAARAAFVMEAEDPSQHPTEPLVVPGPPAGATAQRPPGDWVNLDELLKLVDAIASAEPDTSSARTEPALGPPVSAPSPRPRTRRGLLPVAVGALALAAFCAGWLLRPTARPEAPAEEASAPPALLESAQGARTSRRPADAHRRDARDAGPRREKPLAALLPLGG